MTRNIQRNKNASTLGDPLRAGAQSLQSENCDCMLFEEARLLVLVIPAAISKEGNRLETA